MPTTTTRRFSPLAASLVALTLTAALAACGNDDDSSETTSTAIAHPAATIPATPVGDQLRWALDHLAPGGQPPTVDEINEHISAEFLRDLMPTDAGVFARVLDARPALDRP